MEQNPEFYAVGIGASAGGLDAVQQLFKNLPDNTGLAFIVIQHLSPDFKSLMPELLAKYTKMQIFTAEDNQEIEPNCIYLNQRHKNLFVKGNRLFLLDKAPKDYLNLPIDIFFHTLGEEYKDKSIGVILSGTGSDGSRGIKTIKEAGGTILVQNPDSAQFNGMPNSAILTNLSDFILNPQEIAEKIVQFTSKRLVLKPESSSKHDNERIFYDILSETQKHSGVNFRKYKHNTLLRRLEKRMSLHNIETLLEYYKYLKTHPKEKAAINQEFLIGVTNFFRDHDAFEILKNEVVPSIIKQKSKQEIIRIWIAGCSSGEEVYSYAILFEDYICNNKLNIDYKIFATDIDKKALIQASHGNYLVNNCVEIDKKYLEEYFIKTEDNIQIIKKIREKIVFSYHDVTNDPPFIRMDLISCRNLLIYFENNTQKTVLKNFQYSLNKDGFLVLGSSESLGSVSKHFKVIDNKWKIYQNVTENVRKLSSRSIEDNSFGNSFNYLETYTSPPKEESKKKLQELVFYKYLGKKHSPVSVFIDNEFTVLFIQGEFKKWLSQSDGLFENNLLKMVSAELASVIKNGIRRLNDTDSNVAFKNLLCTVGNDKIATNLFFEKVRNFDAIKEVYLIQFGDSTNVEAKEQIVLTDNDISNFSTQRIEDLEYELKEKSNELQDVVEALETSNEELQSSNEELMSSNEELQSANEELQSVNEELYTVNTEFQEKNKELENLNNDITNLLNSTEIGTLFLDTKLNIRKFTPTIKRIFNLEDTDIGRSISSFASEFKDSTRKSIINDSKISLEKLQTFEKEIQDNNGNWYLKRISPFITSEKKIEGVVITFVEINNLKKTRTELSETESRLDAALEAGNMAWWEVELPSGNVRFSKNKTEMIGRDPSDFKHYKDFMKIVHPDDYDCTMDAFKEHLEGKKEVYECQYRIKNSNGEYQWFQDVGRTVFKGEEKTIISGIVTEVTKEKETEFQLIDAKKKAETANIYKNQFLANMSHEIRTPMNGLIGFANLLRNSNLNPETKNMYIDIIENSSSQLLNLINDIIDVSKIEAGELNLRFKSCHLEGLLYEIEATFNEIKKKKNHKENVEIIAKVPKEYKHLIINTDSARLQQVLVNLIGNALKFTDKGSVEFGFSIENKKVVFYVKDNGIGMPQEKLDIIFERFQRIESKDKAKYDGTGLGLSISKGIVNLLGGDIKVESIEGKGSNFVFDIPFEVSENVEPNPSNKDLKIDYKLLEGKSILIVEDNKINKMYLEEIFKDLPLSTLWAENGYEAIDTFKKHPEIHLALMDIRMPELNGLEASQKILKINPKAKIIAQTAYAMSSDKEKYLKSGFVDYISKPLKKEQLLAIITKWL